MASAQTISKLEVKLSALEARLKETESHLAEARAEIHKAKKPSKIVLCFDGTSNQFNGNESDTNIVKLYEMLNRNTEDQYHYYQPGIGTYVANSELKNTQNQGQFSDLGTDIKKGWDQMFGKSFADHIVAGYKFLMRYYKPNDKIYVFGFSRGAYTARFLSEMICKVGLLSRGNEEMVDFLWYQYSDYQRNPDNTKLEDLINGMSGTFCRKQVKVFFLGLFDCVNSVTEFSIPLLKKSSPYIPTPSAVHVRHAVSLHERRAKFKPALFLLENPNLRQGCQERWFIGNHGDVGGGWGSTNKSDQKMVLSDIPLVWMIDQLQEVDMKPQDKHPEWDDVHLEWDTDHENTRRERAAQLETLYTRNAQERSMMRHDPLARGRGSSWPMLAMWWFIEFLPLRYYALDEQGKWSTKHSWNLGCERDIPLNAKFHPSVEKLREAGVINETPEKGEKEPWSLTNCFGLFARKKNLGLVKKDV